jgi:hypothetical protein
VTSREQIDGAAGDKAMRDVKWMIRKRLGQGRSPLLAGLTCLILLLAGCAPAALMTRNYAQNREDPDDPTQVYSVSSAQTPRGQTPPDQTPLMTTKDYKEAKGHSARVYQGTFDQVWEAALASISQFQARVTKSVRDSVTGDIEGGWVGGESLEMHLDRMGNAGITVKIRVGQFGDQAAEERLFAKINDNLRSR